MKTHLKALLALLAIGATSPALAGPDWQMIEKERRAKAANNSLAMSALTALGNQAIQVKDRIRRAGHLWRLRNEILAFIAAQA